MNKINKMKNVTKDLMQSWTSFLQIIKVNCHLSWLCSILHR